MFSHSSLFSVKYTYKVKRSFHLWAVSIDGGSKGKTQVGARLYSKDCYVGAAFRFLRHKHPKDV